MSLLLFLLACGGHQNTEPEVEILCEELSTSFAQDTCRHDALAKLAPAQYESAILLASEIQDPIVRGAAIIRWIETHKTNLPVDAGQSLCALLPMNTERGACVRRFSAAHLQR